MLFPRHLAVLCVVVIGLGCTLAKGTETNPEYIGCYGDDKRLGEHDVVIQERALSFEIKQFTDKRNCIRQCYAAGYKYAGLQNGNLCFCGENFSKYGRLDDDNCNIDCIKHGDRTPKKFTSNFFRSCGGRWANSVYSVVGFEYEQEKTNLRKAWQNNL